MGVVLITPIMVLTNAAPRPSDVFKLDGGVDVRGQVHVFSFTGMANAVNLTFQGSHTGTGGWTNLATDSGFTVGVGATAVRQLVFPYGRVMMSVNGAGSAQCSVYVNAASLKVYQRMNNLEPCTSCCDECAAGEGDDTRLTVLC